MFDVLVYLYENYWRPDACPDHDQLTRKLSSVGFESDEIQEALSWLDGVATAAESYSGLTATLRNLMVPAPYCSVKCPSSNMPLRISTVFCPLSVTTRCRPSAVIS